MSFRPSHPADAFMRGEPIPVVVRERVEWNFAPKNRSSVVVQRTVMALIQRYLAEGGEPTQMVAVVEQELTDGERPTLTGVLIVTVRGQR